MDDSPYRRPSRKIAANQPGTLLQQLWVARMYLDDPDQNRQEAWERARRKVLPWVRRSKR